MSETRNSPLGRLKIRGAFRELLGWLWPLIRHKGLETKALDNVVIVY